MRPLDRMITFVVFAVLSVFVLHTCSIAITLYMEWDEPLDEIIAGPEVFKVQPVEGLTFEEFWHDRFTQWAVIDAERYASGESKSKNVCRFIAWTDVAYNTFWDPIRIIVNRFWPDSWVAGDMKTDSFPPDELVHGSIVDMYRAIWWEWANSAWFFWINPSQSCKLPPPQRPDYELTSFSDTVKEAFTNVKVFTWVFIHRDEVFD